MLPKILIINDNTDIYDPKLGLANMVPIINEKKTFGRDLLFTNKISIKVSNSNNFFSINNPATIFSNTRWRYKQCKIFDEDNISIWDGDLTDIITDHEKATSIIISNNRLGKLFNRIVEYESSDWETPATAFRNIADSIGFDKINEASISKSENYYLANDIYIKVFIFFDDNMTFHQLCDKLGMIGGADVFNHENVIYFSAFEPFVGGTVIDIKKSDLRSLPKVQSLESDLTNDYSVNYVDSESVPAVDSANNNIGSISRQDDYNGIRDLPIIDGTEGNQIEIKDLNSAVLIGESYTRRSHMDLETNPRPPFGIVFDVSRKFRRVLNVTGFFRFTFSNENWTDKLFEIFQTQNNLSRNNIKIFAVEREEPI